MMIFLEIVNVYFYIFYQIRFLHWLRYALRFYSQIVDFSNIFLILIRNMLNETCGFYFPIKEFTKEKIYKHTVEKRLLDKLNGFKISTKPTTF